MIAPETRRQTATCRTAKLNRACEGASARGKGLGLNALLETPIRLPARGSTGGGETERVGRGHGLAVDPAVGTQPLVPARFIRQCLRAA